MQTTGAYRTPVMRLQFRTPDYTMSADFVKVVSLAEAKR
jgi:hypothetical protein